MSVTVEWDDSAWLLVGRPVPEIQPLRWEIEPVSKHSFRHPGFITDIRHGPRGAVYVIMNDGKEYRVRKEWLQ